MQQFRRDKEVLAARPLPGTRLGLVAIILVGVIGGDGEGGTNVGAARDADHAFVYEPFVAGVHALIDFVHDAKGAARQRLEGHEVEDGGDGPLAPGLPVGI